MAIDEDFAAELKAQGLPPAASLADLIQHHRANAALTAVMDGIGRGNIVFADGSRET